MRLHTSQLRTESPDDILEPEVLVKRCFAFAHSPDAMEPNMAVWRLCLNHDPNFLLGKQGPSPLFCVQTMPQWIMDDKQLLVKAIMAGYRRAYPGKETEVADAFLHAHAFLNPENIPDDPSWLIANLRSYPPLFFHLPAEERDKRAVDFVLRAPTRTVDREQELNRILQHVTHPHVRDHVREAHAFRFGSSDQYPAMAALGKWVCEIAGVPLSKRGSVATFTGVRSLPLDQLLQSCQRAAENFIDHADEREHVAMMLWRAVRARRTPVKEYSDTLIVFLGTYLPPGESAKLQSKVRCVARKRDREAFQADFPSSDEDLDIGPPIGV